MIKKLAIIMGATAISMVLHGMELQVKNLKRTGTADQGSQSRRPDDKPDITLNLGDIAEPLPLSASNGKPSIKSLKQVSHLKNQQDTFRASTGRNGSDSQKEKKNMAESVNNNNRIGIERNTLRQSQGNNNTLILNQNDTKEEDHVEIESGLRRRSKKIRSALGELSQNTPYSSEDMWDMLKKANPKMYEYATDNHLSIDEVMNSPYDFEAINPQIYTQLNKLCKKKSLPLDVMMEYAHLSENNNIEPEALGHLVQFLYDLSDSQKERMVDGFKEKAKKNKEEYMSLALDFITRTCDESGLKEASPINKAQVDIQNQQFADERSTKQKLFVALLVVALPALSAIPGWVLTIVQYVTGHNVNATG